MIRRATITLLVLLSLLACKRNELNKTEGESQEFKADNLEQEAKVDNIGKEKSEPVEVKRKVKRERVEQSYFKEHNRVEAKDLPELSMLIFGIPYKVDIPETEERALYLDGLFNQTLYILNISEEIETLNLSATDPVGKVYSKILKKGKRDFSFENRDHGDGTKLETPAVTINFNPLAAFDNGIWTIEAFINDNQADIIRLKAKITPDSISVTPVKEPNPFDYDSSETFKSGETIYIFGNNEEPDSEITVALYHITNKINEKNESILEAFIATKVTTDSKGKYSLELVVGDDMPKGGYKVAHGKVIDGVNEFEAYINIE